MVSDSAAPDLLQRIILVTVNRYHVALFIPFPNNAFGRMYRGNVAVFERITINRQGLTGFPFDLGSLAEALLFYKKVRVIVDPGSFFYLLRSCGPEELLHLFAMGALEIEFYENQTAVAATDTNRGPIYELKTLSASVMKYEPVSRKFFDEWAGPSGKGGARLFKMFGRNVSRSEFTVDVLEQAHSDLIDQDYLSQATAGVVSVLAPEYALPEEVVFRLTTIMGGKTYQVETNIDFAEANKSFHLHIPAAEANLSISYILIHILNARRDLIVGSRGQSDFSLGPEMAVAIACKLSEIVKKANKGMETADLFQEDVIDNVPRIRDVVNSGERNFTEVVALVEKSVKFKEWLHKQGSSDDLRRAYLRDVSHIEWADKIAPKSIRMLIMSAASISIGAATGPLAGIAGGLALSVADTFLVDKIIKGWKPNQFIEESLRPFLIREKNLSLL
jgi:hypothetical protein